MKILRLSIYLERNMSIGHKSYKFRNGKILPFWISGKKGVVTTAKSADIISICHHSVRQNLKQLAIDTRKCD
jgi:hypothetical protein